jgi:F-type H+-transporting ATPase subunit b
MDKAMKRILPVFYGVCGSLFAALAFAEEAAEGHEEAITFMGDWLPRLVNFGIIAVAVVYFMRKPARDFFRNRTAEIAKNMQESAEAREQATAALAEMERKVKELQSELTKLVAEAEARGEKDRQALVDEGKKVVQDVQQQVKQGVDIEVRKAKAALATEAALLSIELAEGKIKSTISGQDHERIVKDYVANVGGKA